MAFISSGFDAQDFVYINNRHKMRL